MVTSAISLGGGELSGPNQINTHIYILTPAVPHVLDINPGSGSALKNICHILLAIYTPLIGLINI